jgi:hypothetical protein
MSVMAKRSVTHGTTTTTTMMAKQRLKERKKRRNRAHVDNAADYGGRELGREDQGKDEVRAGTQKRGRGRKAVPPVN